MVPFLKKANERFDKPTSRNLAQAQREKKQKEQEKQKQKAEEQKVRDTATKAGKDPDQAVKEWKQKQKDDAAKKKQPAQACQCLRKRSGAPARHHHRRDPRQEVKAHRGIG